MDQSNSCIQHEVKVKKEPVDEDEEPSLDHNLSHLTNGWFEFRCNSGEVLFYFNIFSNEHRWMGNKCTCSKENLEEISSQSIGIQCDIDSKPKDIPSQDVSTEIDFSLLGEQEARIAVSVQTEVSCVLNKSFRDEDLSKESIFPLEFVLPTIDPSTFESESHFKPICVNVHDGEQAARAPKSILDSSPMNENHGDDNKEEIIEDSEEITKGTSSNTMHNEQSGQSKEFLNEGKSKVLSDEPNDGRNLKEHHSLNKCSLDDEISPEENSSDLSYETADEYDESAIDIVSKSIYSNNISSQEKKLDKDQSSISAYPNDDITEVAASEEKFLLESENNCEENLAICHGVIKTQFSDVSLHTDCNPSDETCEKETENDSCSSNVETSREENLNTPALNSFDGELPSDSCPKSNNTTKSSEEPKETQQQESEQSETPMSCKKVKPQTARKCADSLRKCLMVREKIPRGSSNIGNSSTSTKWYLRKRNFRNKICTDPFSKRLKIHLMPLEQDLPRIGRQLKSTFNKGTGTNTDVDNIIHIVKHDHSYFSSEDDGLSQSEYEESESDVHSRQNSKENTLRDTEPNSQAISIEHQHCPGSESSVTTAGLAGNVSLYVTESNQVVMHIVSTEVAVSSEQCCEDHPQTTKELKDVSECVEPFDANILPKETDLNANYDQRVQTSSEKRKTLRKRKKQIGFCPAKHQRRKTPVQRTVDNASVVDAPFTDGNGAMDKERQSNKDEVKENYYAPSNYRENPENSSRELLMGENHEVPEGNEVVEHFILNEIPDDSNQENISKGLLSGDGDEVLNEYIVLEQNNEDVGEIQEVGGENERQSRPTNKHDDSGDQPLVDGDLQDVNQVVEKSSDEIQGALKESEPRSHSTNKDSSPGDQPLLDEDGQDVNQVFEKSNEDEIQGALKESEPRSHPTNKGSCPEGQPLLDEDPQDENQVAEIFNKVEIQGEVNENKPCRHSTNKDSCSEDQPLAGRDRRDENLVIETSKEDDIQRHENEKRKHDNPCSKGSSSEHHLLVDAGCEMNQVVEKSNKDEFREKDDDDDYEPKGRAMFQDDRQEDVDDKEHSDMEKKGHDDNDETDTPDKAKEKFQDFEDRLEGLHKFDENQNECKNIYFDKIVKIQNKSTDTNQHLEDHLQDLAAKEENEDAYAVGDDVQSKLKEKTEKLEENHEQSPILDEEHQGGNEIETQRENEVKSVEKESESKTDGNQEKIQCERQEHGDRVAGCILEDGNETKETEIVGPDETREDYESQKQEKNQDPEQKLSDVEASGQFTKEPEPISQGCQSDDPSAGKIPIHLDSKLTPTPDKDAENSPRDSVGYSKLTRQYRKRVDLGCKLCDKRFRSSFKLACHLRGHKRTKLQTCKICLRTFRSHSLLCKHMKYHNTTSKYSCSYCNEGFISHQKLVSHFIKCNETKSPSKKSSNASDTARDKVSAAPLLKNGPQLDAVSPSNLTCNICNAIYAYPKSFRKHLELHSSWSNGTPAENALGESSKALDNDTANEDCKAKSMPGDETVTTVSKDGVSESQNITSSVDNDKNGKPFSCSVCGMSFVKAYWFDRHMQYKHGISPGENPAGAEEAANPSEDADENSEPLGTISDDNTDENSQSSFECSFCGMIYTKEFWLTRHMQNKHGVSREGSSATEDVVDKADENPLDCSVCGMHFKLEYWLNRHKEKKHGISPEEVPTVAPSPEAKKDESTETGQSRPQLENVVKVVSGEGPLKCYRCGIVFKKEYWYKRHVKIKHGMSVEIVPPPSPFQAPEPKNNKQITEKASKSTKESQKNHPQIQGRTESMTEKRTNERKMHKCNVCEREFVHLGHLENHSKHHAFENKNNTNETGTSPRKVAPEKPPVEVRKNAGKDRNPSLGTEVCSNDDNVVIGYKQNNFKCSECPEEFAHLDDLLKHNSQTHAPHKCPHCEVRCSTSEELQSHLLIHRKDTATDGVKKISCKICGKEVSTAVELITHFRTHKRGRKRKVSETEEKEDESPPLEEQSSSKSLEPTGSKSSDVPNSQTGKETSTMQDPKETPSESVNPKSPKHPKFTDPIRSPTKQQNLRMSVFFCYLCNKAFHNIEKRLLHMKRSHPDGNRYVCSTCGRGFQESHLYNLHKREHHDMNSAESQAVSSAESSTIPDSNKNDARSIRTAPIITTDQHFRFRCSDCGRGFQREHFYNMHKLKHHNKSTERQTHPTETNGNDNSENTERSHNDDECIPEESGFPKSNSTGDLGSHSTARSVSFSAGVSTKPQKAIKRKHFTCSICSRIFFKRKNFRRHEHEHEREDNMQSTEIPCVSKSSSTCQSVDGLSSNVIDTSAAQENGSLSIRDNVTAISKNDQSQNSPGRLEEMRRQEKSLEFPYTETSCKSKNDVSESASSKASQNDSTDTICQDKNDAATAAAVCNNGPSSIENSMTNESEDDIINAVGDNRNGFVTAESSSRECLTNEIQNNTVETVTKDRNGIAPESTILYKSQTSNEANLAKESKNDTYSPSRSVFQYLDLETHTCAALAGEKYKCSYCTLSFTSLYQRNSHVCTIHKMKFKQGGQQEGPGLLETANQAARPQVSASSHILQDESELSKSLDDKEFINSSAKGNDHSTRKRKYCPNILRRSKIGRSVLYGDDLNDQDGSILSETMTRNDNSFIESLEKQSNFIFDLMNNPSW